MKQNEIITYKWANDGWTVWSRRIVLPVSSDTHSNEQDPPKHKRWRPCWWHHPVTGEQVLSSECPDGWAKGRLPGQVRCPCVRCGRAFNTKKLLLAHECINAK